MTTITGTAQDAAGDPQDKVRVTARLVAATTALTAGGQIITGVETVTGSDGTWSLTLTPTGELLEDGGAHYIVLVGAERYTIEVPDSGTHELGTVLVVPAPLADTGATTAALQAHIADTTGVHGIADTATLVSAYLWDEDSETYVAAGGSVYIGPEDPGDVGDGSIWLDTGEE